MRSGGAGKVFPRLASKERTRTWATLTRTGNGMKVWVVLWMVFGAFASTYSLDREAFTFSKYDLNVQVEPEQQRLAVRGKIVLRNDSSTPQKNAVLQISSSLTWRSILADGKPLQFVSQPYTSDVDHTGALSEAIVSLPADVPPGGGVELEIGYEGVIPLDATRLTRIGMPKEKAVHSDWDQIGKTFTAVRGAGYVAWYPIATEAGNLSEGNSVFEVVGRWKKREVKAEMKIHFLYATNDGSPLPTLLCSGVGVNGYGRMSRAGETFLDCEFSPVAFRVPAFVMANYDLVDGTTARIQFLSEHKANAEKFAQASDAVAPFVKEWFGVPQEKAQIIELADPGASPFESGATLLTPLNDPDPKLVQIVLVHELTHAAFPSPRPWIYEGLAHFAQAAYREHQLSRVAALDFLGLHRAAVVEAEKQLRDSDDGKESGQPLISTTIDEFYRSKAAYVWWMLKDMLGEEVIQKALAVYRPEKDTEPNYMQRLLETQSKRDLQWFFDDWVYHDRGLPNLKVESAYVGKASQGNYLTTVTVDNLGAAGAEIHVTVHFDGGDLNDRVVVRGKAKGVLRIATPRPPTEVTVNDGSVPEIDTSNNSFKVTGPAPAP
jgi:hypothetical protein